LKSSLNYKIKSALNWLLISSISLKFLQVLTSIVLIKLLDPNTLGIVALIVSILYFVQGSMNLGFDSALIQKSKIDNLFNCAWTLEIIKSLILSGTVLLLIPLFNFLYDIKDLNILIYIVALIIIVDGFKNIGMITYRKELNFKVQYFYEFVPALINMFFAILLAYLYREALSIIIALLFSRITVLFLSYKIHPLRPRIEFNIKKFKSLFNFGIWITFSSLLSIFRLQGLTFFISKFFNLNILGIYNRSSTFSEEIFNQFSNITWKLGFPLFSKTKDDIDLLNKLYYNSLKILSLMIFPFSVYLFLVCDSLIKILFDEEWYLMVSIIKLFSILGFVSTLIIPSGILFQSIGKPKISTRLSFYSNLIVLMLIYPLSYFFQIQGVLYALILSIIFVYPFHYFALKKNMFFSFKSLFNSILPSITGTFFTSLFFSFSLSYIDNYNPIQVLLLSVISMILYALILYFFEINKMLGLKNMIKS
tara:strand:- start:886 stop:2319 length:1434 start_codon:yes stop_codon:yes gene_type:complete